MLALLSVSLYLGLMLQGTAASSTRQNLNWLPRRNASLIPYALPNAESNVTGRASGIQAKRDAFLYGPSIAGNVSFWYASSESALFPFSDIFRCLTPFQNVSGTLRDLKAPPKLQTFSRLRNADSASLQADWPARERNDSS